MTDLCIGQIAASYCKDLIKQYKKKMTTIKIYILQSNNLAKKKYCIL